MTARVNLLPAATREGSRRSTAYGVLGGLFVLLFVILGGVFWWISSEVSDAEERLAAEQDTTAELRADEAALAEFADLESRVAESSEVLAAALSGEVSVAGFLQDLALVTPEDAQLESLTATVDPFTEETETVGNFAVTGTSTASHAPGLERLLLDFEKIGTITEPFLTSSVLQDTEGLPDELEDRVAAFTLDAGFTRMARTERYVDGLPEALR